MYFAKIETIGYIEQNIKLKSSFLLEQIVKNYFLVAGLVSVLAACGGNEEPVLEVRTAGIQSAVRALEAPAAVPTVRFPGTRADYVVEIGQVEFKVTNRLSNISMVLPLSTARIQFADGTLVTDLDGNGGQVYRVYQAAFDRQPDAAGYAYWLGVADRGTTVETIASGFVDSDEFRRLYGSKPSNADFLMRLYQNVLHRAPDQAGFNFYLNVLNQGAASPVQVLADFSNSPENRLQVADAIKGGIWVPSAPDLRATVHDSVKRIVAGGLLVLDLTGASLTGVTVTVGGQALKSTFAEGRVTTLLPASLSGSQVMKVSAAGQSFDLPLQIEAPPLLPAPKTYLTGYFSALSQQLDVQAALPGSNAQRVAAIRALISEQVAKIPQMSEQESFEVARSLNSIVASATGSGNQTAMSAQRALSAPCVLAGATFSKQAIDPLAFIAGAYVAVTPPVSLIGSVVAVGLLVKAEMEYQEALQSWGRFMETCTGKNTDFEDLTDEFSISAQRAMLITQSYVGGISQNSTTAKSATFSFIHDKARTYAVKDTFALPKDAPLDAVTAAYRLASELKRVSSLVKLAGVDYSSAIEVFSNPFKSETRPGRGIDFVLGTISDSRIQGTASGFGDKLNLTFIFREGNVPNEAVAFKFDLLRADTKEVVKNVQASLTPNQTINALFKQNNTLVSAPPPGITQGYETQCAGQEGQCGIYLTCSATPIFLAQSLIDMRYILDAERGTVAISSSGIEIVGKYSPSTGAIKAETISQVYESSSPHPGVPNVKLFNTWTWKIDAAYDSKNQKIIGKFFESYRQGWSIDSRTLTCAYDVSFVATKI